MCRFRKGYYKCGNHKLEDTVVVIVVIVMVIVFVVVFFGGVFWSPGFSRQRGKSLSSVVRMFLVYIVRVHAYQVRKCTTLGELLYFLRSFFYEFYWSEQALFKN